MGSASSCSDRDGGRGLFSRTADGTGEVEHLVTIEGATGLDLWGKPVDDERLLVSYRVNSWDVALLSLDGEPALLPMLDSEANEAFATVSPDGRWIAYNSDESGNGEIYAQRFPDLGDRQRISTTGGTKPLWSPDGNAVMVVPLEMEPTLTPRTPTVLFEMDQSLEDGNRGLHDISPDGQRFLAVMSQGDSGEDAPQPHLVFVQNWFQELTERVPVP